MLKALLKKQFLGLNSFYFQDRKKGERRSKTGTIIIIVAFVFIYAMLAFAFYGAASMLVPLVKTEYSWLYYSLMGLIAILFGVFGSVFNTYSGLYQAKDNELLLSMPIKPSMILFVRISGVWAMGLLYEALVLIPTLIARFVYAPISVTGAIYSCLLVLFITLFVTFLSCLLGFFVALIASKLKNRSYLTVIFSLAFLAAYYFLYMRAYEMIENMINNAEAVSETVRSWLYIFYQMGLAAEGNTLSFVIFAAVSAGLFALTYFVLSKTFIYIATKKESVVKKEYKKVASKAGGTEKALFRKEWKHFLSSPTYMLNCALGTVLMPILSILLFINMGNIGGLLEALLSSEELEWIKDFIPVIVAAAACFLLSTIDISAPSVSLEGRNIWVLQSMPVPASKVLDAKQRLHLSLTVPPAVFFAISAAVVLKCDISNAVLAIVFVIVFSLFMSALGIALNLKMPNLTWTNEAVPVKQSIAVMLCLFGGWVFAGVFAVGGFLLVSRTFVSAYQYLIVCAIVLALATRLLNGWIRKRGAEIFENL